MVSRTANAENKQRNGEMLEARVRWELHIASSIDGKRGDVLPVL